MMPSIANSSFAATRRPASRGRTAFTLTEMLVALAVMVLALAVATNVFSVTTKTAATSAAIADVAALVRNFSYQIEQDLEKLNKRNRKIRKELKKNTTERKELQHYVDQLREAWELFQGDHPLLEDLKSLHEENAEIANSVQ